MQIFVTGVAGFIGSRLAAALLKAGHNVAGIDSFSTYYSVALKQKNVDALVPEGLQFLQFDLCENNWQKQVPVNTDYIFHLAAQPGISKEVPLQDYIRNNITATQNVLQFAEQLPSLKMLVHISTSSVYGSDAGGNELSLPAPVSDYGVTKLAAEQLVLSHVRQHKLAACVLRMYSVYGPGERPDKLYTKLIDCAYTGKDFPLYAGSLQHLRSFTFVDDIVAGVMATIGNRDVCNGEIFNLGSPAQHSTEEGIAAIEKITGKTIQFTHLPARPGDQLSTKANIEKARSVLNFSPDTSLFEGLKKQVEWFNARS